LLNKILITGANGFIGKKLQEKLLYSNFNFIPVDYGDGDITDTQTWGKFPKANVLIHLAGKTYVPDSWIRPGVFIKCNHLGTVNALNYCLKHNARLVFLSSYLYGNPTSLPIKETNELHAPNPYALSKKLAEETCIFYYNKYNISSTILRPFNVFGPGQSISFLIPSILQQITSHQKITVRDLSPKRDYIFVDDLVDMIIKSIGLTNNLNIFNVGSGVSHSVIEVINLLQAIMSTSLPVYTKNDVRKNEIIDTVADISQARKLLSWEPKHSFREGLKKTIDGYN